MNNKTVLRKLAAGVIQLAVIGLLSACGGGGGGGAGAAGGGGAAPALALFAGSIGGAGSIDGTGKAARFAYPSGAAADSAGNIYVADQNNHTIRKITPAGVVTTLAGTAGVSGSTNETGAAARFNFPTSVATDRDNNIYVADATNHIIRKITQGGLVTTLAGTAGVKGNANGNGPDASFDYPISVATDSAGNVYVADYNSNIIRKITPSGLVSTLAGTANPVGGSTNATGPAASFSYPSGVATDGTNVYVADSGNNTIRMITPLGVVTTLAGTGDAGSTDGTVDAASFDMPSSVATDSAGNVYVADTNNNTIRKITPLGGVTTLAGTAGNIGSADAIKEAASFFTPNGVSTDKDGNVYVADSSNNTIRKITPSFGVVTTLAGSAPVAGSADGALLAATFNGPSAAAIDSDGNVYLADQNNNVIRKISALGVVSTLAGTAGVIGHADATGDVASFNQPSGVATDSAGNVYVADRDNNTIRKITPDGLVTTLAGTAGLAGSTDGNGAAARFDYPVSLATDSANNIYVADQHNNTIRKISAGTAEVTTLAGTAGTTGSANGIGAAARFDAPSAVVANSAGIVYVIDQNNNTIRKISDAGGSGPGSVVTTLAGSAGDNGSADGNGANATFDLPAGMTIDSHGNLYVADQNNNTIRKITPAGEVSTVVGVAGLKGFTPGALLGILDTPLGVAISGTSLYIVTGGGVAVVTNMLL